jgi:GH24 family phage-related lysozyme (muramidase)
MQPVVRRAWRAFNEPLEGLVTWMYLDVKGLVTTGMGNLIDPLATALDLRWFHADGSLASAAEVRAEWTAMKDNVALAHQGAHAAHALARLHLQDADINALILGRLDRDEAILKANTAFAAFEDWPADAQLGLLSMAWAMGPGFGRGFPHFAQACAARDFTTAAADCQMAVTGNPGLIRRNAANRQAFLFAGSATDPTTLRSPVPPL